MSLRGAKLLETQRGCLLSARLEEPELVVGPWSWSLRAMGNLYGCGVCCTFTSIMGIIILTVVSNLLDNEYPFLQKELFLHLGEAPDFTGACTRGEGCKCAMDNGTLYDCDAAGNASTACMYGAVMYVITLAMSGVCCLQGKQKKTTGVGAGVAGGF